MSYERETVTSEKSINNTINNSVQKFSEDSPILKVNNIKGSYSEKILINKSFVFCFILELIIEIVFVYFSFTWEFEDEIIKYILIVANLPLLIIFTFLPIGVDSKLQKILFYKN